MAGDPDVKPAWAKLAEGADTRKDFEQEESAAAGIVLDKADDETDEVVVKP